MKRRLSQKKVTQKIELFAYKLRDESLRSALKTYDVNLGGLSEYKYDAEQEIESDKEAGNIGKNCKPEIIKITVEVVK